MRASPVGLMVLGLLGVALVGVTSPVPPISKVVIGVLDFETSGISFSPREKHEKKEALMKELRRNARVKLVDIREFCSLSDLKRNGYEKAERYKDSHQLDMILHTYVTTIYDSPSHMAWRSHFGLIDLYMKKVKGVSIETRNIPIEDGFRGISQKLLVSQDLNRVLTAKKEASEEKEGTVPREVKEGPMGIEGKKEVLGKKGAAVPRELKESPEEMEVFLIQNGPKLIAQGEYSRVLELIEDLPGERRRHSQIQTLACLANLKGWVSDRDQSCKLSWVNLRQKLIKSGDKEATPILVIFLRDKDLYLRLYAADLLSHIGDKRALKDLREVGENDENHKVRRYAKKAYEQISGEKF